ncbi:MAG: site-specific integrase, partial [Planctomycetota bacterium]|nr:site-specific integrase [Planctomycetota bacterium]
MDELIDRFLEYLETEKNVSEHTLRAYSSDLRQFHQFLGYDVEFHPDEVSHLKLRRFLAHLREDSCSKTTINRKLSSLRAFYRYLIREQLCKHNPLDAVRSPKRERKLPNFLTSEEVLALLEAPDKATLKGRRDRAILETFYSSGLRISELVGLDIDDIDFMGEVLVVRGKGKRIKDGDKHPSPRDSTDYGMMTVETKLRQHKFFIKNNLQFRNIDGYLVLTGTPRVSIIGAHPKDFKVTMQPRKHIGAGKQAKFKIGFTPRKPGLRRAIIRIENNDPERDPYRFAIQGLALVYQPDLALKRKGQKKFRGSNVYEPKA